MENRLFDISTFDMKLDTDFIGRNFIYFDEIESTNSFLMESKDSKFPSGTLVLAEFQTKGRGRLDRTWFSSKEQNLTFSILLKSDAIKKLNPTLINFGTAVVIGECLHTLYQLYPEYKWPNDVLVNKKKISGLLLDSTYKGAKIETLIVGIGINLNQPYFQGDFNIPPTSVRLETKELVSREKFLAEFLNRYENMLKTLANDPGKIMDQWKYGNKMIGSKITVTLGDEEFYGFFDDLDADGLLVLSLLDGTQKKFSVGEVSVSE